MRKLHSNGLFLMIHRSYQDFSSQRVPCGGLKCLELVEKNCRLRVTSINTRRLIDKNFSPIEIPRTVGLLYGRWYLAFFYIHFLLPEIQVFHACFKNSDPVFFFARASRIIAKFSGSIRILSKALYRIAQVISTFCVSLWTRFEVCYFTNPPWILLQNYLCYL